MVEEHDLRAKLTATYIEKTGNPFSDEVLQIARNAIAAECGVPPREAEWVADGQPFHLRLLHGAAQGH